MLNGVTLDHARKRCPRVCREVSPTNLPPPPGPHAGSAPRQVSAGATQPLALPPGALAASSISTSYATPGARVLRAHCNAPPADSMTPVTHAPTPAAFASPVAAHMVCSRPHRGPTASPKSFRRPIRIRARITPFCPQDRQAQPLFNHTRAHRPRHAVARVRDHQRPRAARLCARPTPSRAPPPAPTRGPQASASHPAPPTQAPAPTTRAGPHQTAACRPHRRHPSRSPPSAETAQSPWAASRAAPLSKSPAHSPAPTRAWAA